MPSLETCVLVTFGCTLAFGVVKFAATQPPAFYNVGAVAIVLAVAWWFVSLADLQDGAGDLALLLFIAAGALGAWRGTVPLLDTASVESTLRERVGPFEWRAIWGGWRIFVAVGVFLIITAVFFWGLFSMIPDGGPSVPRRTRPPQTSSPSP